MNNIVSASPTEFNKRHQHRNYHDAILPKELIDKLIEHQLYNKEV